MFQKSIAILCYGCMFASMSGADDDASKDDARAALHTAVAFFRNSVGVEGGYVYRVSADLSQREGEERVGEREAWVQPPATPAVGRGYLRGYQLTDDKVLLDAAIEVADALIRGQLESGGWSNNLEFDPELREKYAYRVDGHADIGKRFNRTTFDDNKSQSCAMFLMLLDQELKFANQRIHETAISALDAFSKAQYPNGAWPQQYSEFPDSDEFPIVKAKFPATWNREFEKSSYSHFYTLNDGVISDLVELMLTAYEIYDDQRWLDSAKHGGDFLLLAQLPEPQPGWAQQYNIQMEPVWARKFEPPAITGGESQGVLATLMLLFEQTGERKYLEPLPRAIDYYQSLTLSNGQMARFYEIGTNRPLYFTGDYELVYTDNDLPTHYGFKTSSRFDRLERDYQRLNNGGFRRTTLNRRPQPVKRTASLTKHANEAIKALDDRGAWVEPGAMRTFAPTTAAKLVIDTRTFVSQMSVLVDYLSAVE